MEKEQIQNEIQQIHREYEKEIKNIKPSFNYIVVETFSDDFIVTRTLQQAKEKAIEYGNQKQELYDIYEVKLYPDNTYRAVIVYSYDYAKKELREEHELRNCLHVAWRTRGDLLEVVND